MCMKIKKCIRYIFIIIGVVITIGMFISIDDYTNSVLMAIIAAVIFGSLYVKLFKIVTNFEDFKKNIKEMGKTWENKRKLSNFCETGNKILQNFEVGLKYKTENKMCFEDEYFNEAIKRNSSLYEELKNDNQICSYLKLTLEEQKEYLDNVDNQIKENLNKACEKIYDEALMNIEKNVKNTSINCTLEEYIQHQKDIVSFYNCFLRSSEYDIEDYIYKVFEFVSLYLNSTPYFYKIAVDFLKMIQIYFNYINQTGELIWQQSETSFINVTESMSKLKQNFKKLNNDYINRLVVKHLDTKYKNTIKSFICRHYSVSNDDDSIFLFDLFYTEVCTYYLHAYGKFSNVDAFQDYLAYSILTNFHIPCDIIEDMNKNKGIIYSGIDGEQKVEKEFKIYENELKYFPNVRFEEKFSVETDGIILSERGIFSIEIKNFKFDKLTISKDGQWRKGNYNKNGELIEEVMKDIGAQVNNHIIITERLFNNYLKETGIEEEIIIKPIIIIANDDIIIENDSDMIIVRASQIYPIFKKTNYGYSKKTIKALEEFINENKLDAKKYEICNYPETLKNMIEWLIQQREEINILYNKVYSTINEQLQIDVDDMIYIK